MNASRYIKLPKIEKIIRERRMNFDVLKQRISTNPALREGFINYEIFV
jgi:hypothetical protein